MALHSQNFGGHCTSAPRHRTPFSVSIVEKSAVDVVVFVELGENIYTSNSIHNGKLSMSLFSPDAWSNGQQPDNPLFCDFKQLQIELSRMMIVIFAIFRLRLLAESSHETSVWRLNRTAVIGACSPSQSASATHDIVVKKRSVGTATTLQTAITRRLVVGSFLLNCQASAMSNHISLSQYPVLYLCLAHDFTIERSCKDAPILIVLISTRDPHPRICLKSVLLGICFKGWLQRTLGRRSLCFSK